MKKKSQRPKRSKKSKTARRAKSQAKRAKAPPVARRKPLRPAPARRPRPEGADPGAQAARPAPGAPAPSLAEASPRAEGRWLIKTEPASYAYADLEREGRTTWEGVSNALALIHLRAMAAGDRVLVYHTGNEKAVTGLARVVRGPYADPSLRDPRRVVIDLEPVARAATPVTLADVRAEPACRDLALLRIPRLSVMPVPAMAFDAIARRGGLPPLGQGASQGAS